MTDYSNFLGFLDKEADLSILLDSGGRARTASLFEESIAPVTVAAGLKPLYTLSNRETKSGLPSAYLIYMSSIDEFDAALRLVGSLTHWRKLCKCKWFAEGKLEGPGRRFDGISIWREDMRMRDASMAKRVLLEAAKNGDVASSRKILDMATDKSVASVGRPGTKQAKKEAEAAEARDEDDSFIDELHSQVLGSK